MQNGDAAQTNQDWRDNGRLWGTNSLESRSDDEHNLPCVLMITRID